MPSFKSLVYGLSLLASVVTAQIGGPGTCDPNLSQPNPVAKQYTLQNTGTINGTAVLLNITHAAARKIIPSQYKILNKQYQAWLPDLPKNQYPALLQMEYWHDNYVKGQSQGAGGDFVRATISFPFVDRLGDGYSAFTYQHEVLISESATGIQSQLAAYGQVVAPAYYAVCNAYEYENATSNMALPPAKRGIDQAGWAKTNTDLSNPDIAYRMVPTASSPYNINYFYNVTNQPGFSDKGSNCDGTVRLYNTEVSEAPYKPVYVQGDAAVLTPYFTPGAKTVWTGAYGIKVDVAYHQKANVACSSLKGFHVNAAPS